MIVRFFRNLALLCLPFISVIIFINLKSDPAHLFLDNGYEEGIAKLLLANNHVTNIGNYNERKLQKLLLQGQPKVADKIVLGSSRIMQFRDSVPGKCFNYGVSMCVLEDIVALYQLIEDKNCQPKEIVVGIDPWIFNENNPENRFSFVYLDAYLKLTKKLNFKVDLKSKPIFDPVYSELISFQYFQESIKKIKNQNNDIYYPTKEETNPTFTKLKDGSISYDSIYRNKTNQQIINEVAGRELNIKQAFTGYKQLSQKKILLLRELFKYWQEKGILISIYLIPFHPYMYNHLLSNPHYSMLQNSELKVKEIGVRMGIPVYGSYNPEINQLIETDFYDEMHLNYNSVGKIRNAALINQ